MYFDTHAHYDDEAFDQDRDELLRSMPGNGVGLILNAATNLASSEISVALSEKYSFVFASVGIHPHDAAASDERSIGEIERLCLRPKVVAIGETGLDYFYDHSPRELQKESFAQQMQLARKTGLPIIVHDREAHADCLEIVRSFPDVLGVFHCFSGSLEMAKTLVGLGWYLSFTGAVTFKNARKALDVLRWIPEERLMIETDCPYLTPAPFRGRRNDSRNLTYIARLIAEVRGADVEAIEELTCINGKRFFGID